MVALPDIKWTLEDGEGRLESDCKTLSAVLSCSYLRSPNRITSRPIRRFLSRCFATNIRPREDAAYLPRFTLCTQADPAELLESYGVETLLTIGDWPGGQEGLLDAKTDAKTGAHRRPNGNAGGQNDRLLYLKRTPTDAGGRFKAVSKTAGRGFESLRPCEIHLSTAQGCQGLWQPFS